MPPKKKIVKKKKAKAKTTSVLPPVPESLPSTMTSTSTQALLYTVASSDVKALSTMVNRFDYGRVLPSTDINGSSAIHTATKKGDDRMLQHLLSFPESYGSSDGLNLKEKRVIGGYAAIHHACAIGNADCLLLLLRAGANPSLPCDSNLGETPLHICCKNGRLPCAQLLVEHGANVDARDGFGHNASFWAYNKNHEHIISALGLPPVRAASAEDYLQIMMMRNKAFAIPFSKLKKKSTKKGEKGKKKK